jgi:hypothetical protein
MIEQVALDALALRAKFPELTLREGMSVVARVDSRTDTHGVIVLAGVPLTAALPPEVQAGQTLHLRVAEVTPEQVTMRLEQPQVAPAPQAALEQRAPRVAVQDPPRRGAAGGGSTGLTLAFDSAVLGRIDLRIDLARGSVVTAVAAPAGGAFELATAAAARLQDALAQSTGRVAQVRVTSRREPFDAYA